MSGSNVSSSKVFIITRPAEQGNRSLQFLLARGATAILRPLISITSLPIDRDKTARIQTLLQSESTIYVCTSSQSVREVRALLGDSFIPRCRVLAQGPRTAAAWTRAFGFPPQQVCLDSRATAVAPLVADMTDKSSTVLVTGPIDRVSLVATAIGEIGIPVERIPLYQTATLPFAEAELLKLRESDCIVVLLYSPSAVEALSRSPIDVLPNLVCCCFGSTTALAAEQSGLEVSVSNENGDDEEFLLRVLARWSESSSL
jgi:uroporphyrinogen-III synthase